MLYSYPKIVTFFLDTLTGFLIRIFSFLGKDTFGMYFKSKYDETCQKLGYQEIVNNDDQAYKIVRSFILDQYSENSQFMYQKVNILIASHWLLYYRLKDIINNGMTIKKYYDQQKPKSRLYFFFSPNNS